MVAPEITAPPQYYFYPTPPIEPVAVPAPETTAQTSSSSSSSSSSSDDSSSQQPVQTAAPAAQTASVAQETAQPASTTTPNTDSAASSSSSSDSATSSDSGTSTDSGSPAETETTTTTVESISIKGSDRDAQTFDGAKIILLKGANQVCSFIAELLPDTLSDKTVKWALSSTSAMSVDTDGKVTTSGFGKADITATSNLDSTKISDPITIVCCELTEFPASPGDNFGFYYCEEKPAQGSDETIKEYNELNPNNLSNLVGEKVYFGHFVEDDTSYEFKSSETFTVSGPDSQGMYMLKNESNDHLSFGCYPGDEMCTFKAFKTTNSDPVYLLSENSITATIIDTYRIPSDGSMYSIGNIDISAEPNEMFIYGKD